MKKVGFGFGNLEVWEKAVDFSKRAIDLVEKINTQRKHFRLMEQLRSAATSVALNIAEGKGRYSNYLISLHSAWLFIRNHYFVNNILQEELN